MRIGNVRRQNEEDTRRGPVAAGNDEDAVEDAAETVKR